MLILVKKHVEKQCGLVVIQCAAQRSVELGKLNFEAGQILISNLRLRVAALKERLSVRVDLLCAVISEHQQEKETLPCQDGLLDNVLFSLLIAVAKCDDTPDA